MSYTKKKLSIYKVQKSVRLEGPNHFPFIGSKKIRAFLEDLTLKFSFQGSSASVIDIASGIPIIDVSGVDGGAVQSLAASVKSAPKSMVVVGDVHAFPQNTEI